MSKKKVALIIGAGDCLGSAIARKFAQNGYHIVATRRRGDLDNLVTEIKNAGGVGEGRHSDARDEDEVRNLIADIEDNIGPIGACVFNVGGNVSFPLQETTTRVYRKVWEMCALAGFLMGREVITPMLKRGQGTIIFTGATASLRGASGYSAFAGGKHALRALAESMAREFGPQGIHIAHVVVDGLIDNPNTKDLFPDLFNQKPVDGIINPDDLADIYWDLHKQKRTAWTFEVDARPYSETF
ncbi:Short-chain dehydrogenase/reductase SDR [Candidatus Terasakiella magnetica]|uniref:Short-chain dehydrogenase/reductase SDR n=1 Tax=Candidatus Terasakiella magnetica TaxID=1867952 RepID=A0A1C3RH09_9PROT|nr:SDR family NAD(P)-dependent oxidoreductase [Candidatus Terasakiella magnetica]SCA56529.1 Short-chain dehydrogenase/reductase SDR [Candidatus Terasakiella magnetica]